MPSYKWLFENDIDLDETSGKISTLRTLGVPYADDYEDIANTALMEQAELIAADLRESDIEVSPNAEIVALIAYLQRLGTDITLKTEDATDEISSTK
ncbi:MAG: cbb3-type cytochrome c oxidase subunit II, partial [Cyclobacteriaceae bacterium]